MADTIKGANQLILKLGDYLGGSNIIKRALSKWKGEAEKRRKSQHEKVLARHCWF